MNRIFYILTTSAMLLAADSFISSEDNCSFTDKNVNYIKYENLCIKIDQELEEKLQPIIKSYSTSKMPKPKEPQNISKEPADNSTAQKGAIIQRDDVQESALEDKPADKTQAKAQSRPKETQTNSRDGAKLYRTCVSCHGPAGKGVGVFPKIAGQSKEELIEKMEGYKERTYGKQRKALMYPQVRRLSSEDIKVLAEYIARF